MSLTTLTRGQFAEWLRAAEHDDQLDEGGIVTDPAAEPDDLPVLGTLLDHLPSERVFEIVGFRAGNATLQVCPVNRRIVTVRVIERKDVAFAAALRPCIRFGSDS